MVQVANGIFAITLDFGPAPFPGYDRFLEVSARPSGGGGFTTLSPRTEITTAPFAIQARNAQIADSLSGPLSGNNTTATLSITNSAVGIPNPGPTNLPPAGLRVESTNTSESTAGIIGIANSTYGAGLVGITKGNGIPGGDRETAGVLGYASSLTGPTRGVIGQVESPGGIGVKGIAFATTGAARGVWGETSSPTGSAFFARTNGTGDIFVGTNDSVGTPNPRFLVTSLGNVSATGTLNMSGNVFGRSFTTNSGSFGVTDLGAVTANGGFTATNGNIQVSNGSVTATSFALGNGSFNVNSAGGLTASSLSTTGSLNSGALTGK